MNYYRVAYPVREKLQQVAGRTTKRREDGEIERDTHPVKGNDRFVNGQPFLDDRLILFNEGHQQIVETGTTETDLLILFARMRTVGPGGSLMQQFMQE